MLGDKKIQLHAWLSAGINSGRSELWLTILPSVHVLFLNIHGTALIPLGLKSQSSRFNHTNSRCPSRQISRKQVRSSSIILAAVFLIRNKHSQSGLSVLGTPPTSEVVLPEYVYFKNPAGRYLKYLSNDIDWYGIKWESTKPNLDNRFRIIQIPNHPVRRYTSLQTTTPMFSIT